MQDKVKDYLRDPYIFDFLNLPGQPLQENKVEQALINNLQRFLMIDLKVGKLNHQDVGQMDTYIRIFDQHIKDDNDNPTIGLILCSRKSEAVAKYSVLTDSKQMFASKYMPFLPSEEELVKELERERHLQTEKE